jgi:NADH-quinone oxidoreductase subunit N
MSDLSSFAAGWQVALPGLVMAVTGLLVMVVDLLVDDPDRDSLAVVGVFGMVTTLAVVIAMWVGGAPESGFGDVLRADRYALFFTAVICVGTILTLLMSIDYLRDQPIPLGDYYVLVLLAAAGMQFMVAANDLMVLFVALEVMSVAMYVLAGIVRGDVRSSEAALKYFLLGAFASAFLLYGIAFFYGATGSTQLGAIAKVAAAGGAPSLYVWLGIAFLLIGFGFKVALMPFHFWTPDVYEGAPTTITAFMAGGVKAAAFAAFGRVFLVTLGPLAAQWNGLLWLLAVLTMTVGNVSAVTQRNVKRMLAYSSIAHAGYAMIALVVGGADGGASLLMYIAVYVVMTMGAFGVVIALGRRGEAGEDLADWAGVGFRHPVLGIAMTVFMLSLAGMPPTAGFAGKFYVFSSAVNAGYVWLPLIGVLNSLISAYYYLGVLVQMYMSEGDRVLVPTGERPWLVATIVASMVLVLVVGLLPGGPIALSQAAFASLR